MCTQMTTIYKGKKFDDTVLPRKFWFRCSTVMNTMRRVYIRRLYYDFDQSGWLLILVGVLLVLCSNYAVSFLRYFLCFLMNNLI